MTDIQSSDPTEQGTFIGQPESPLQQVPVGEIAEMILMHEQMLELRERIVALEQADEYHTAAITRLSTAVKQLPCPAGQYVGLPAEGWTGRPEDAGAKLSTVGECTNNVCCECCAALASAAYIPEAPHSHDA